MDFLGDLRKHPVYEEFEDVELTRTKFKFAETLIELKSLLSRCDPNVEVINEAGETHYKGCWGAKLKLHSDRVDMHCLCLQLHYLRRSAENLLNDIGKLSGNKKHKGLFTSLSRCCGSVEERD